MSSLHSRHVAACYRICSVFGLQEWFPTWRSAPWNLHVELDGVHAQDGVSYVAEHVPAGRHAHESGQLLQLLKLRLPPEHREQSRSVHFQTRGVQDQLLLVRTGDIHARRQRSAHLLGSERSMLVPNLMIFPTAFCSALGGKGETSRRLPQTAHKHQPASLLQHLQRYLPAAVFRDVFVGSVRVAGWLLFPLVLVVLLITAFLLLKVREQRV